MRGRVALLTAAMLGAVLFSAPAAQAQGAMSDNFKGLSGNSNEPIDIESDTLEVDDKKKTAIFKGNVKAKQGGMTLQSNELEVAYEGQGAGALASGADDKKPEKQAEPVKAAEGDKTKPAESGKQKAQIKTIQARGKVLLSTDKDQSATSDWALFDIASQVITIGGNVVLSQGGNVIRGDKLIVDLKSGQSRFDTGSGVAGGGGGGRVKGLFMPSQGKALRQGKDEADKAEAGKGDAGKKKPEKQKGAANAGGNDGPLDLRPSRN